MNRVSQVRLTGKAARFLQMVQDLGHLDEEGVNQVLLSLAASDPALGVALADVGAVREAAAAVLFERAGEDGVAGILAEDWPLMFS